MTKKQEELIWGIVERKKQEIDELMRLYYKLVLERHEQEEAERGKKNE